MSKIVYDSIDQKIWREVERYEESSFTMVIFKHACSTIGDYGSYLIYRCFPDLPLQAMVSNRSLDDLDIINSWNPYCNTERYTETAERVLGDFEMAQIATAFKNSGYAYWGEEQEYDGGDS